MSVIETFRQLLAKAALVFRPRRGYACHAGISDKLPHVLVAVNDQAEIDGIGCSASLEKLNPSLHSLGFPWPARRAQHLTNASARR